MAPDLSTTFTGIRFENPFLLSSAPPTESESNILRAFDAGWGGVVASLGWAALGRTLFVYGLAARVPVAALMLPAILGKWGTHYDALPPNWPAMGPVQTWALIGLLPQMTLWIGLTLLTGMLVGSITGAIVGGRRREPVATAA